jgi:hypothetical protein
MPRKPSSPNLAVVPQQPLVQVIDPPGKLSGPGMSLWRSVLESYEFSDAASYQVLYQSCACVDRAESCREIIDRDGELLYVGKSVRSHPLLRDEVANRALACRLLARLGLDLEPLRSGPGRPPIGIGVTWKDL